MYIAISRDIPGARTTAALGTFLAKVFEGSYRNMGKWTEEMRSLVKGRGRPLRKLFFFSTACPRGSKKYGKNHVVILARI